jgi:hypothetical protein
MMVRKIDFHHEKSFSADQIYEVPVGSVMVSEGFKPYRNAFKPKRLAPVPNFGVISVKNLTPDDVLIWFGTVGSDYVLCRKYPASQELSNMCIITDPSGNVTTGWINRQGYAAYVVVLQGEWKERDIFEPMQDIPFSGLEGPEKKDIFYSELLFSGCTKDYIKINYREFREDLARPAFYQEIVYDRSEKEISFRGLRLEIMDATNTRIKFRIIGGSMMGK